MAGVFHGGGVAAAMAAYGGRAGDWLDLSTGINPEMAELPEIPARVWNRLPDRELEFAARAAARDWYLGAGVLPPSALPAFVAAIDPLDRSLRCADRSSPPTGGESGWGTDGVPNSDHCPRFDGVVGRCGGHGSLSPLVGEMPGRAEGGSPDRRLLPLPVPGTQSLIQILPRLMPRGRPVAILSPTYGEYAHCFRRAGFAVEAIGDPGELRDDHGALIVVNPNNPTGRTFLREDLVALAGRMRRQGGHLHVDEAFGDGRGELSIAGHAAATEGVTVSRSFGKFFGLAGLRLGFVFAVPATLEVIAAELGPWPVSGPALHVANHLLRRDNRDFTARIAARARALAAVLDGAGLKIIGGTDLFKLVRHPEAARLYEHLARSHILVRRFDYAGDWLRIGLTPDEEGDRRLADALAAARD